MGKKSKSPDTVGAANAQGKFARETARDTNYANRPDQYNPFGSQRWGSNSYVDPSTGETVTAWSQNTELTGDMQQLFDQQTVGAQSIAGMQSNALERAEGDMSTAADFDQFGEGQELQYDPTQIRQRGEDAAYGRATSRLDPQYAQQGEAMELKLRNQGLRAGDQAYDEAMGNFGRDKNDAYEQARMGATGAGVAESKQLWDQQLGSAQYANALRDTNIDEYLTKRNFNLNEAKTLDPTAPIKNMNDAFGG